MSGQTILIVEDQAAQRDALAGFLRKLGYSVEAVETGKEALGCVRGAMIDCVLTDFRLPDLDGAGVLVEIRKINPDVPVILMTAYGSVEDAVSAMKQGAYDYLSKPIDVGELEVVVSKALERRALISENKELRRRLDERRPRLSRLVSQSKAMEEVLSVVARAAPTRASVLLMGESGTGKELIARGIHDASTRHARAFVALNCAALPESLFESELFGHEKGAFTGADRKRIGRFEEADGGTLFIDEIGDTPLSLQAKLLRAVQEGEFQRVGGNVTNRVDVRIVAATHRNLELMMERGEFREDLYYRLNVVAIQIPPLRERRDDIPALAGFFIERYASENGKHVSGFSREAMELLMRYDYPGNVRELENAIERAVAMARETILTTLDLPLSMRAPDRSGERGESGGSLEEMVEALERTKITEALDAASWNQSKAAQRLGMSERNLRYKLKKYRLR